MTVLIDPRVSEACERTLVSLGVSVKRLPLSSDLDRPVSGHPDLLLAGGYDHCLNFVGGASEVPQLRGRLRDPKSGRCMEIYTDQPSIQVYSGNFLGDETRPFKGGIPQKKQGLLCLETQRMPDSVNHSHFTNTILRAGQIYRQTTEYRFSVR